MCFSTFKYVKFVFNSTLYLIIKSSTDKAVFIFFLRRVVRVVLFSYALFCFVVIQRCKK